MGKYAVSKIEEGFIDPPNKKTKEQNNYKKYEGKPRP